MKTLFFLSILSILTFSSIFSQSNLEWDTRWSGPTANDYGSVIAIDDDGNVYVSGVSDGTANKDYLTIKYSPEGVVLWTQRFNGLGNGDDEPTSIELDVNGNVYVTGRSKGTNTGLDIVTIKYNPLGVQQWLATFNGSQSKDDIGYDMVLDVFGNLYVCGTANDAGVVIKYNPGGTLMWYKYQAQLISNIILINHLGNIIVSCGSGYNSDYFFYELDPSNGNTILLYNNPFGGTRVPGFPSSMVLDKVGNIYVMSSYFGWSSADRIYTAKFTHGIEESAWSFYHSTGSSSVTSLAIVMKIDQDDNLYQLSDIYTNVHYYYIKKVNNDGNVEWVDLYISNSGFDEYPVSLSLSNITDPPEIYLAGYNSYGNIRTIKYSNNGDTLWTKIYDCGINALDIANAMVLDKCDNMYITGSSSCNGTYKDIKTIKYSTLEAPVITVTGTLPLCLGQQVTLSVPQCDGCTYLWSSGQTTHSITVSPTETTTYKVTVTNSSLCAVSSLPKEVKVNPVLTPSISITASKTEICAGENVIFTATPVNGGLNPVYDWYVDGVKKSSGGLNSFSSTTLIQGSIVKCIMTSNASCLTTPSATSNEIQMTVNPKLTASVTIQASKLIICAGESVTFTALPVNGGTAPTYKWYGNNILQAETSEQFTVTGPANGAKVYVEMYSNAMCVTPLKATSNELVITVNPLVTPTVSIAASSSSVCFGQNITFTATPVKGGTNPSYQWYINNELQPVNTATFSSSLLPVGSVQVYCIMTSSVECVTQANAVSNFISVAVNPLVVPKAKISASSTAVFFCEEVIFNVTPTNGGLTPTYKWFVNNNLVATGATYKSSSLLNGSKVYCIMTSTANCVSTPTVNSDTVTISVFPLPQPEIKLKHDTISVTNYSGAQYKYSWYYKGVLISNEPFVICSKNGNGAYYVIVSLNTCTVTSSTVEIDCTTSTQDISNSNEFIIYPNPTDDKIFIEGKTINSEKYSIALYNMLGVKLDERILFSQNYNITTEFDLSAKTSGIYMIAIVSSDYKKVFMVEKF